MAIFVVGDLHLSLGGDKPMDVFEGWEGYLPKLEANWRTLISPQDTVILAGDTSWAMKLEDTKTDFAFIQNLPGQKWLLKGNHDYWWSTAAKFHAFCEQKGFTTLELLHNNCFFYGNHAVCGTRGWFLEEEQKPHNAKVLNRELLRLETSLKAAGEREKYCFLHYPPLYQGYRCQEIIDLLERYQVSRCFYGHLHGGSHRLAISGRQGGVEYDLVSADYLGFQPKKILD